MAAFSYIRILWFLFLVFRFRFILGRSSSGSSEQRCKRIEQFHGGDVTYTDSRKIHSNAFYSCDEAYSLFPRDIDYSNCTESLEWKPEPPTCMKKAKVKVSRNGYVCKGSKDIILHKESYIVCCRRGYELYSDRFLERKRAKITNKNGTLVPEVPRCVEERCDPADQYMADVHYQNGTKINTKVLSRTSVYFSCKVGYHYYRGDQELKTPLMRKCLKGNIKNAPICREGKCLFSGIPMNSYTFHREYLGDAQLVAEDQLMDPNDTVEVFCLNTKEYELYVNTTQTYVEEFTSKCRFGNFDKKKEDFPICLERRCSFDVSTGSCYWVQDEEKCLPEIFTIPSQSSVNLTCKFGYKLFRSEEGHNVEVTEDASIFCNKGVHSPVYECIPEKCTVPTVKHAWLLSKGANTYENGEKISFICDKEFHFYQNISTTVDMFETTCSLGNWTDNIPNECKPDGCKLNVSKGYRYIAENAKEISATKLMEHRTAVDLQCLEMFDLFDKNDNIFLDKGYIPTVTCYQGTWQNEHFCRKRCVAHNVTNGRLTKKKEIVKAGETVVHGETVSVECDDVVNDSVLSMKCLKGEWQNLIDCIGEGSSQTPAVSTAESTTTDSIEYDLNDLNTTPVSIGTVSQEVNHGEDILPENNIGKPDKQNKGCKLSDDSRYIYTDNDGLDKDPGLFISEGTRLTVSCSSVDLYEFYTNYYDSYDAYSESNTTVTVTCIDNELSDFDLDCPEVSAEACFHLQNGRVRSKNGYFYVSCDRGYSLDLILPEKTECTCENGKLRSVYGGQEPNCVPDKCVVPYEIDQRLSVTDRFRVSLSGGSVVEIGSFVFFNCSKTDASIYEPLNRRFKCYNGLWLEAERDINWKLGFNGEFPSCREAICEPNCTNGGVCYKDDNCRCKHLTEGKRCEKFLCEEECVRNGGECTGPGKCSCPKERTGRNCEHNNCVVPTDIDSGLSMTDRNSVSLLGSDFIVSGTFVYFNCSQKGELTYEPSNRRFQCLNGRWTEADSDSSWKLGNNGMFPQCREALCKKDCLNDGFCIKDDNCKCGPFTSGKRCEKVNCAVPIDIDSGLSMTDRNRISLLGSDFIVSGTFVYFNCSQKGGLTYEPSNRRFQCLEGRWIEADSDNNWKLGNNGEFPNCREVICGDKCKLNGGKCMGHGECSCTEGRYGSNCEHSHHKKCSPTFDAGHRLYPKWEAIHALEGINSYFPGKKKLPSDCQQACLKQRKIRCKSVYFFQLHSSCHCLTVSDPSYFYTDILYKDKVYFLTCS